MKWPDSNPFIITAIEQATDFYGRKVEVDMLTEAVRDRAIHTVLIEGPRRIGKTSLLKHLKYRAADDAVSVYMDTQTVEVREAPADEASRRILKALGTKLCNALGVKLTADFPTDSQGFREEFLPRVSAAAGSRRIVFLIDEAELLQFTSPQSVEDLLAALQTDEGPTPLLVMSWGRPLGVLPTPGLAFRLRASITIGLEPFPSEVIREVPDHARAYQFTDDAKEMLFRLTSGHPFYVAALNFVLFERRKSSNNTKDVHVDELLRMIDPAHQSITEGLMYAWSTQLSAVQSLLGRAIAELAAGPAAANRERLAYVGRVPLAEVAEKLKLDGHSYHLADLQAAAQGLEANRILAHDGDAYYVVAPFLGYWLCAQPLQSLLSGDKSEAKRYLQTARRMLETGDRRGALDCFKMALSYDPRDVDANIFAADLQSEIGNVDDALRLLKAAALSEPQTVRSRMRDLLLQRLRSAVHAGEDPRTWYFELLGIDESARNLPEVVELLSEHYLKRWAHEIQEGSVGAAAVAMQELARENVDGWRRRAAAQYVAVQRRSVSSEERLRRGLAAVRDAFMLITEETIEEQPRVDSRELLGIIDSGGSEQEILERIRGRLSGNPSPPEAWLITIDVLDKAFQYDLDRGEYEMPIAVLKALALRAPGAAKQLLHDCYRRHLLPNRLRVLLERSPDQALSAIQLLSEMEEHPDLEPILDVLDENAVELESSGDQRVLAFFEHGAALYSVLLGAASPRDLAGVAKRAVDQIHFLVTRMRPLNADGTINWDLFINGWAAVQMWNELLARPEVQRIPKTGELRTKLEAPLDVMRKGAVVALGEPQAWASEIEETLAKEHFEAAAELPMDLPGIPNTLVKTYRATWRGEAVNVKVYRLVSENFALRRFLVGLWENERRVLFDVATRRRGRALTRLKFAKWGKSDGHLLVVTEPVGPFTLRKWLDRGHSVASMSREEVWRVINALIEAVSVLHDSRHLHRTIRPESIFLNEQGLRGPVRLGNFEWSIYVHSITEHPSNSYVKPRTYFDRYSAPESLRGRFQAGSGPAGENFGSDIYSLGLVLFELLVRRLKPYELGFYPAQTYDFDAHCAWIEGLREEVRANVADIDERLLLLEMLAPDVRTRMSELTDAVELSRRFMQGSREVQQLLNDRDRPPRLVTTLHRGTPECIENFLDRYVDLSEAGETVEELVAFLQRLLAGARIYRNGGNPARPLVIEGRRVTFAARPLEHDGAKFTALPYLTVATSDDRSTGPEIARLPETVEIGPVGGDRPAAVSRIAESLQYGEAWKQLFEIAAGGEDTLEPPQREFHSILRVTAEVERSLWDSHVVPYKLVSKNAEPPTEIVIEPRDGEWRRQKLSIAGIVAQDMERGYTRFELGPQKNAIANFDDSRTWTAVKVEGQRVRLKRDAPAEVLAEGFLRPESLRGNRSIYRRRQDLLRNLEDDVFLLTAITEPRRVITDSIEEVHRFFNPKLDEDKKRIVERVIGTLPLFIVQGPPGTGKTTLAAEVIRQTLDRQPSSRILVASQAHEPLNNLLSTVDKAMRERDEGNASGIFRQDGTLVVKPIAVRLTTEKKLARSAAESVEARFHPSTVAEECLQKARKWQPNGDSRIDAALLQQWRSLLSAEEGRLSVSIADRIVASANLVYVTANDRSIGELSENQTFDLLIFEEAAKAYPLEVLAPMRLARRWLLIGDHEQLPPFDIEAFRDELVPQVRAAIERQKELRGQRWGGARLDYLFLGDDSHQSALQMSDFFLWLHGRGSDAGFADRLSYQWRMHPEIRGMLQASYFPYLLDGDDEYLRKKRQHGVVKPEALRKKATVWIDVPLATDEPAQKTRSGSGVWRSSLGFRPAERPHSSGGYVNDFERVVLHAFMRSLQVKTRGEFGRDIAFLSPYRAQVLQINRMFANWTNPNTGDLNGRAFTVDSFQGRQADMVVVSLVRNNLNREPRAAFGFLGSEQRAGVMFSRAEALLVVIGCSAHFAKEPLFHINRVFEWIQEHGVIIPATELLDTRDYDFLNKRMDPV
jgi:serine/threonine protein kinase/tetratricopeptide (TPR) repeat protein